MDLDNLGRIDNLDSLDVLGAVERFADQCREAWALGRAARDLPDADGLESVVVLGMGGSGISGDVVQSLVEPRLPVPLRTIKGYGPLPEWIGRNTLVLAVSYSGNTEETLAAFEEAHNRGVRAVTISSGGSLAELAQRYGVTHIEVPPGLQPRASLGYLALPLLAVLVEMGLVPDLQDDLDEAVEVLAGIAERCHRKVPADENPAKQLAAKLHDRIPLVYGSLGPSGVAAYRFKCDLNEYAKTPAFHNLFPELDHNEIVGWGRLANVLKERFAVVLLRHSPENERNVHRIEITERLISDKAAEVITLRAEGDGALAQLLSLVLLTQFAAIYLGLGYEVDPGPVEIIQSLKQELSQR